jgi:hypothetical protein
MAIRLSPCGLSLQCQRDVTEIFRTHRFLQRGVFRSALQSLRRAYGQRQRLLGKSGARYSRGACSNESLTHRLEVLPNETELSAAPVATFFEGDAETIIAKAEPVIPKGAERGSLETDVWR